MPKIAFDAALDDIVGADPRYPRDAYLFVRDALDVTIKTFRKHAPKHPEAQHVNGQELLEGIRRHALHEFGPMAHTVFEHWRISRCEDFGEIVFNLVNAGVLGKTDHDSREDFKNGYDFDDAFLKPFRPARAVSPAPPAKKRRGAKAAGPRKTKKPSTKPHDA